MILVSVIRLMEEKMSWCFCLLTGSVSDVWSSGYCGLCHWWPSPELCADRIHNSCSLPSFYKNPRNLGFTRIEKKERSSIFFTGSGELIETWEAVEILGLSGKIQLSIICIGMGMSLVLFSWTMIWVKLSKYEQTYTCGWTWSRLCRLNREIVAASFLCTGRCWFSWLPWFTGESFHFPHTETVILPCGSAKATSMLDSAVIETQHFVFRGMKVRMDQKDIQDPRGTGVVG